MLHRHHEAGRAESALRAAPVAVSFLDGRQAAVLADPFDRRDLLAFATGGSMVQESMGMPSTGTVQAPQEESSQPRFDPVSCKSWRRASSRSLLGSTAISWVRPLTRSSMSSFFM